MISRTLGAPLGGTTRGGHQVLEPLTLSLMTPPNFNGCGGSCSPLMTSVALVEPGAPLICGADPKPDPDEPPLDVQLQSTAAANATHNAPKEKSSDFRIIRFSFL